MYLVNNNHKARILRTSKFDEFIVSIERDTIHSSDLCLWVKSTAIRRKSLMSSDMLQVQSYMIALWSSETRSLWHNPRTNFDMNTWTETYLDTLGLHYLN